MNLTHRILLGIAIATNTAIAQEWQLIRPSNTGIPGELVNFAKIGPDQRVWVSARWPFWQEGGIGIYDKLTDRWETISNAKGQPQLSSPYINDFEFTPGTASPVTWIATDNGLVKWENGTFAKYTKSNTPALLHNTIRSVAVAPNGHIWVNNTDVNSTNAALFEFDGVATWKKYSVGQQLPWSAPWNQLNEVFITKDGHVWVSHFTHGGMAEFDGVNWTPRGIGLDNFGSLTEDAAGHLWMVGGLNKFYKYNRATASFTTFGPSNTPFVDTDVTCVAADTDGTVYAGNWVGQVIRTTNGGQSWEAFATADAQVFSIAPDPIGDDVWISTIGAVRHHNGAGQWLAGYNSRNTSLGDFFIEDIHLGQQSGKMWVASLEHGVSSFDGERFFNLGSHNPNEPWPAMADGAAGVYEDKDGNVWVGTNGIGKWDGSTFKLWDWQNNPLIGGYDFKYFAQDKNGAMWAGSDGAQVARLNGNFWVPDFNVKYDVKGMQADYQGNVWVADDFILRKWDGSKWSQFDGPPGTPFFDLDGMTCLAVGLDNTIWVGTNKGLVRYDGVNWKLYTPTNSPLPALQVRGIDFRADGAMALSAHEFKSVTPFPNGVSYIVGDIDKPASWTTWKYGTSPLPHYQLGDVSFDAQGHLWVSAIAGEAVAVIKVGKPACNADCDGDSTLSINDFICFQTLFAIGDPSADCDGDTQLSIDDFICFQTLFAIGC